MNKNKKIFVQFLYKKIRIIEYIIKSLKKIRHRVIIIKLQLFYGLYLLFF